jgi:hypothetical protein
MRARYPTCISCDKILPPEAPRKGPKCNTCDECRAALENYKKIKKRMKSEGCLNALGSRKKDPIEERRRECLKKILAYADAAIKFRSGKLKLWFDNLQATGYPEDKIGRLKAMDPDKLRDIARKILLQKKIV